MSEQEPTLTERIQDLETKKSVLKIELMKTNTELEELKFTVKEGQPHKKEVKKKDSKEIRETNKMIKTKLNKLKKN